VIFLLRDWVALLGVAIGLLAGCLAHNLAQAYAARSAHDPAARLSGSTSADPRRHFEPFGVIAMVVSALGWPRPVALTEPRRRAGRGRYFAVIAAGPLATLVLGLLFLVLFRLVGGELASYPIRVTHAIALDQALPVRYVLEVAGVTCLRLTVLELVPLPPLDGARVLWALAPQTAGWQKARYNLEEQNWGLGILLLLMLPLFGGSALIIAIVDAVASPVFDIVMQLLGLRVIASF
jgi:Zn-dependent protease